MTGQKLGIIRGAERNLRGFAILTDTSASLMGVIWAKSRGSVFPQERMLCAIGGREGEECVRMGHD